MKRIAILLANFLLLISCSTPDLRPAAYSGCETRNFPKGTTTSRIRLLQSLPDLAFYHRGINEQYTILVSQESFTAALSQKSVLRSLIANNPPQIRRVDLLSYVFLDYTVDSWRCSAVSTGDGRSGSRNYCALRQQCTAGAPRLLG
jgi:hypothetical protein